jgi:hypothetical protein
MQFAESTAAAVPGDTRVSQIVIEALSVLCVLCETGATEIYICRSSIQSSRGNRKTLEDQINKSIIFAYFQDLDHCCPDI